jgi:hypothetical protein
LSPLFPDYDGNLLVPSVPAGPFPSAPSSSSSPTATPSTTVNCGDSSAAYNLLPSHVVPHSTVHHGASLSAGIHSSHTTGSYSTTQEASFFISFFTNPHNDSSPVSQYAECCLRPPSSSTPHHVAPTPTSDIRLPTSDNRHPTPDFRRPTTDI